MSPLEGPSGPLVLEGSPADGAFRLTGRRAFLDGHARTGVARLVSARGEMIRALKAGVGGCRRFRFSPGSLLRELEAPGGPVREVAFVPRDLPGAVFQWSLEGGAGEHRLAPGWLPGEGLESVDPGEGAGHVLAALRDPSQGRRVFLTAPEDSAWSLEAGGDRSKLATDLVVGRPAFLAVVERDEGDPPPGPDLFRRLPGWEKARAGAEAQAEEELLGAHAAGTGLHQGVAWARARLESPVLDRPSSDAAWIGLGALCAGRFDLAREALATLTGAGEALADAHRLLDEQVALWAGGRGRNTPEDPRGIPVPVGATPPVLERGALAARADPVQMARALCTFVVGTLGARPDAGFGRLRLAPTVPSRWLELRVRNLPMGDVRVTLGYRRDGRAHTFTLRQTRGSVPANLVFEPLVPEADLGSVRVDGQPAELEVIRRRGWVGTRLQLPLDPERRVVLEGRGNG